MFHGAESPVKMLAEIRSAEEVRDQRLSLRKERLLRLAGPFASQHTAANYEPENRLWEYAAYTLPKLAFSNPRVSVRSRVPAMRPLSAGMQGAMNRWCSETNVTQTLRYCALDFIMDYCVALVTPEPHPGNVAFGRSVWWPQAYQIDPHTFFIDPLASRPEFARFMGHVYTRDLDDLIREAEEGEGDWHLESVLGLKAEAGVEKVYRDRRMAPPRNEVAIYEVFVPELHADLEEDPDDGFSGTLYTLGCGYDAKGNEWGVSLRAPRAFYGPRTGPYVVGAFLWNPEVPMGLSPTTPAEAQIRDLSDASRAALKRMRTFKTMTTVPASDPTAVAAAQSEDCFVVPLKGDPESIRPLSVGGLTQQDLAHLELKGNTLDRVLGMADIQRGLVAGEGTASEVLTAQAASDIRTGDVVGEYRKFVQKVLHAVAWYCYHDDRFIVQTEDGTVLVGGPSEDGSDQGMQFDDLQFEIEAYSMDYESGAARKQRAGQTMELVSWISSMIVQAPYWDWPRILDELGDLYGIEDLAEMVDYETAMEVASAMVGSGSEQRPQPKAMLGRGATGAPINVKMQAPAQQRPQVPSLPSQQGGRAKQPQMAGGMR